MMERPARKRFFIMGLLLIAVGIVAVSFVLTQRVSKEGSISVTPDSGNAPTKLAHESTPKQVGLFLMTAILEGDTDKIQAAHDKEAWKIIAPIWSGGKVSSSGSSAVAKPQFTIVSTLIEENRAALLLDTIISGQSDYEVLSLKQTSDGWRIDYAEPIATVNELLHGDSNNEKDIAPKPHFTPKALSSLLPESLASEDTNFFASFDIDTITPKQIEHTFRMGSSLLSEREIEEGINFYYDLKKAGVEQLCFVTQYYQGQKERKRRSFAEITAVRVRQNRDQSHNLERLKQIDAFRYLASENTPHYIEGEWIFFHSRYSDPPRRSAKPSLWIPAAISSVFSDSQFVSSVVLSPLLTQDIVEELDEGNNSKELKMWSIRLPLLSMVDDIATGLWATAYGSLGPNGEVNVQAETNSAIFAERCEALLAKSLSNILKLLPQSSTSTVFRNTAKNFLELLKIRRIGSRLFLSLTVEQIGKILPSDFPIEELSEQLGYFVERELAPNNERNPHQ